MTANQELRKLYGVGAGSRGDDDVSKVSTEELVNGLAQQTRELRINIDLNYQFAEDEAQHP
jgi:hypothetical protein